MARPPRTEGRDTRQAILDASLDLFAERGYFGTSMREIGRAVGVRESALYHHFESKQAIFQALLTQMGPGRVTQLLQLDVDALVAAVGARAMLRRLLDLIAASFAIPAEQKLFRVMLQEGARLAQGEGLQPLDALERVRTALTAIFRRLVEKGAIRRVDPATTAALFMGPLMLMRVLHLARRSDFKAFHTDLDRLFEQMWESIAPVRAPTRARKAAAT